MYGRKGGNPASRGKRCFRFIQDIKAFAAQLLCQGGHKCLAMGPSVKGFAPISLQIAGLIQSDRNITTRLTCRHPLVLWCSSPSLRLGFASHFLDRFSDKLPPSGGAFEIRLIKCGHGCRIELRSCRRLCEFRVGSISASVRLLYAYKREISVCDLADASTAGLVFSISR